MAQDNSLSLAEFLASAVGRPAPFGRGEQAAWDEVDVLNRDYDNEDGIKLTVECEAVGAIIYARNSQGFPFWQG